MALNTGGRLGELLGLKWADIDTRRGRVSFRKTKAKRARSVPVEPWLVAEIESLPRTGEWVFSTMAGERLRDVRTIFHAARERAGLGRDVVFHLLRHTFASRLGEQGVPASTIMKLTGHSSLRMLERYTHPTDQAAREAVAGLNLGRPVLRSAGDDRKQNGSK
jgi:integrase